MHIISKIGLCLTVSVIFFTSFSLTAIEQSLYQDNEPSDVSLIQTINTKVLETIKYSENIPGLNLEEFSSLRNEIYKTWKTLFREGVLGISGTDKDVRPYFVALQGLVEQVLSSELQNEVKSLKGFIHTPMPATPLCTTGVISEELVDHSIEIDPNRVFTVKARASILRDYLSKGGDLYVIYPKEGLKQRTPAQQKIYKQELLNYPEHLFDVPLNAENIPTDLIGATYLFQDQAGNTFVFAIKMTQARDPKDVGNFGLWFGSINHPSIRERLSAVSNYMERYGSKIMNQD